MRTISRLSLPLLGSLTLLAAGCAKTPASVQPEFLVPADDWAAPFSPAVRVGNLLYLSGQVGRRPGATEVVEGGIEAETRQTMENIRAVLEASGSSLEHVFKCTVMLADMAEWPRMNEVYASFFPGPKPARSALGANGLALDARVEIECIATVP